MSVPSSLHKPAFLLQATHHRRHPRVSESRPATSELFPDPSRPAQPRTDKTTRSSGPPHSLHTVRQFPPSLPAVYLHCLLCVALLVVLRPSRNRHIRTATVLPGY